MGPYHRVLPRFLQPKAISGNPELQEAQSQERCFLISMTLMLTMTLILDTLTSGTSF